MKSKSAALTAVTADEDHAKRLGPRHAVEVTGY